MRAITVSTLLFGLLLFANSPAEGATLTVKLDNPEGVTMVGVFNRWDIDGNHRRPVNTKARIDEPEVDATGVKTGENTWVFKNLPKGNYDLVIMKAGRVRIEGWTYPPVLEFDPFFPNDATIEDEVQEFIRDDISKSKHYENKVATLEMGGDKKIVRVLVMLLRDKATSYTPGAGTLRFEVWQYTWKYGGWQKEKRTRVLHRILDQVSEIRQWTWVWEPNFGGIKVGKLPKTLDIEMPSEGRQKGLSGLHPY